MRDDQENRKNLEAALKGLAKVIKAVRYYPPAHPSLQGAVEEARQGFEPVLSSGTCCSFAIHREGFVLDETAVGADNTMLQKLAPFLFSRRIQRLIVLPDLSVEDLRAFARCLLLEPAEIQRLGGVQEVLQKALVSTLWVNEVDLEKILARKEELDARKKARAAAEAADAELFPGGQPHPMEEKAPPAATEEESNLQRVLRELEGTVSDQRYRLLAQELVHLLPLAMTETGRPLVLRALLLLCRHAGSRQVSEKRRDDAREALDQLAGDDVLDFLVGFLCSLYIPQETREKIDRVLGFLREKAVHSLMGRLAGESDLQVRRILAEALVRQGRPGTPILLEYLEDERWYVVLNAVTILGEIRTRETAPHLLPLLHHPEVRVRRETIRALTRIGGPDAVEILLQMVQEGDPELRPQALLSLGAMKDPAAVSTLIRLVDSPDPWVKNAEEKKGAIKALGEIGSAAAAPVLVAALRHRTLWRRRRYNEVRAAAAAALGLIGGPEAEAVLEAASEDRAEEVARAATQALKQLRK